MKFCVVILIMRTNNNQIPFHCHSTLASITQCDLSSKLDEQIPCCKKVKNINVYRRRTEILCVSLNGPSNMFKIKLYRHEKCVSSFEPFTKLFHLAVSRSTRRDWSIKDRHILPLSPQRRTCVILPSATCALTVTQRRPTFVQHLVTKLTNVLT